MEGTFGGEGGTAYGSTPVKGGRIGCDRRVEDADDYAWEIMGARGRTVGGSVEDSERFCRGAKKEGVWRCWVWPAGEVVFGRAADFFGGWEVENNPRRIVW